MLILEKKEKINSYNFKNECTLWNTQVKSGNNKAKANKTECE